MLLIVLLLAVVGAAGWHFSSVLLRPTHDSQYPDLLYGLAGGKARLQSSRWTRQPGTWALRWSTGMAVLGPVLRAEGDQVTRRLDSMVGDPPPPGTPVAMDAGPFDLPSEHGLDSRTVSIPTPLGDCPAWFIPAEGQTWVIAVHGRGADRRECLRILPVLHRLGHPVLAISYRNDRDAPASPDGLYHLGDTEWLDLAASVSYARDQGATGLVLYGWSMGAAITAAYLDRAPQAAPGWARDVAAVRAVVWDSPLVDWRATLRKQAELRRLPRGIVPLTCRIASYRTGIDFERFDLVRHPPSVRPPTLVFHGDADSTVPVGPSRALAARARGLGWPLRYIEVPGAEHTAAWNVDPARYEAAVARFLQEHAVADRGQARSA